jgi:hypothetical protein
LGTAGLPARRQSRRSPSPGAGRACWQCDQEVFSFSAFGTLAIVHSSEDLADFSASASKPRGAGHSRAWSAEPDSLVAAQVAARISERFSAVLQVVSEQNHEHSYRPHVEWANLKYEVTPGLSLRVGRTVLPVLMLAEVRKVGYANPWVRPPVEIYQMVPVTSNDGVDASYRTRMGAASNTFHMSAGQSDLKLPGSTAKVRKLVILDDTFEHGFATVRVNVGRARITLQAIAPLLEGLRRFGPEGMALADKYEMNESSVTFLGVGASYDPGPWFVMGEWSRVVNAAILGRKSAWYASGGYRFGKVTPFVTYARATADNLHDPGLTLSALPPSLAGPAAALNAGLNAILSRKVAQDTASVGARWDVARHIALKVQYDHTRVGAGSNGMLINLQPGFRQGGKVNLLSASVDFIFK